jgi:hypothetical protein
MLKCKKMKFRNAGYADSLFSNGRDISYSYLEKLSDIKDFSIILLFKAVKPRQKTRKRVFLKVYLINRQ